MKREKYLKLIKTQLRVHPICAILGPRQSGKTTLAAMFTKEYAPKDVIRFDLENPTDLARLENPMLALSELKEKIVLIDEIQKRPDLFPVLRVIVDNKKNKQKFLILGSASRDLIRQSSQTLAGRIGYLELTPFSLFETKESKKLWLRGGYPRSYLAKSDQDSFLWRQNYIKTFLERDIPALGFNIPPAKIQRFWLMLAHYHGQIFNASELARSLGISNHTVMRYLDILSGTFMIRVLRPWFENLKKRQIKSPKIYFRDSGILHSLLGITDKKQLDTYPKLGAFWEGFALEETIRTLDGGQEEVYFWGTQAGAELDLLVVKGGKKIGFEFKYTDAPKTTKSMRTAEDTLKLDQLRVIYPGKKNFKLSDKISAHSLENKI